jgi:hypothetical protein
MDAEPTPTIQHLIAVNDDEGQTKAICGRCGLLYDGTNRRKKLAACHRHLADMLDPPKAVEISE